MELKRVDSLLIKTLYTIAAFIVVTQVLNMDTVSSLLFTLTFPLTILLWFRSVRISFTATDGIMLTAIALATISVFLNAAFTETRLTPGYLKKVIMFSMTLIFLQSANRLRIERDVVRFIGRVASFLAFFFVVAYFLMGSSLYMINDRQTNYLVFNFTNPNMTGLFLMCLYILLMHQFATLDYWFVKLFHVILAMFIGWFVWLSQSRNCLLVMVIYTAVYLWLLFRSRRKEMWVSKFWAMLAAIFPVLFVILYMVLISTDWAQETFAFLMGQGKNLNSRTRIWALALIELRQSPVIGAYSQLSAGDGSFQMHNTHLDMAASYGLPVMILVCILLYKYFYRDGYIYNNKPKYTYIIGFMCAVLLGIGEAALFSGGLGIYIFMGSLLLLANSKDDEEIQEIEV